MPVQSYNVTCLTIFGKNRFTIKNISADYYQTHNQFFFWGGGKVQTYNLSLTTDSCQVVKVPSNFLVESLNEKL